MDARRRPRRARIPCGVEAGAPRAPSPTRRRTTRAPSSSATRPGRTPGRQAHVERAVHVAAPQRGQEARARAARRRARRRPRRWTPPTRRATGGPARRRRRRGPRAAGAPRRCRPWRTPAAQAMSPSPPTSASGERARPRPGGRGGVAPRDAVRPGDLRRELDEHGAVVDRGLAQAQVEDGQLLLEVGGEQDDDRRRGTPRRWWRGAGRARPRRAARRRAGSRRSRCRGRPWPAWPRRTRPRWRGAHRRGRRWRRARAGRGPGAGRCAAASSASPQDASPSSPDAPAARERRAQAVVGVDRLEAEAALVAQPAVVGRLGVDAEVAHEAVGRRLHARCGSRPRTWCRSTRPARGPTGGPGSGRAWR